VLIRESHGKAPLAKRLVCLATIALAGLVACSKPADKVEPPLLVEGLRLQSASRDVGVAYAGTVQSRYETILSFRVPGKIIERRVEVGDRVRANDVIARIDPRDYQLAADNARAQIVAAKSDYDQAHADATRYAALLEKKFISAAEYERRQAALTSAKARLDAVRSQSAVAENQSAYATLRADSDGAITAVDAEVGQVVTAGAPIVHLARAGSKEVTIHVPENRLDALRQTASITVLLWALPERSFHGKVREIAAAADTGTRTYPVRVTIEDADENVRLGMTAKVTLAARTAPALYVPVGALQRAGADTAVWVVRADSSVERRPVRVGEFVGAEVAVTDGLRAGEVIVTAGANKLHAGQKVRVRGQPA
jgi:RND family efflux transporter MFP subunit